MKVYQLERIKKKQVFDDVFPIEVDVFLYECSKDAIESAMSYYDKVITRFDHMKQHDALQSEGCYSIFTEKPETIDDLNSATTLNWTIKAYIQDVIHEIHLSIKENNVITKQNFNNLL